jgi:hypothetical protein
LLLLAAAVLVVVVEAAVLVELPLTGFGFVGSWEDVELFDCGFDVESSGFTAEDVVVLLGWRIVLLSSVVVVRVGVAFVAD